MDFLHLLSRSKCGCKVLFFSLLLLTYKTPVQKIVYKDVQLCNVLAFIVTMSISFSPLYTFFALGHLSVFILLVESLIRVMY